MLPRDGEIGDVSLAVPLSLGEVVEATRVDDAVARILLARKNGVLAGALAAERAEGRKRGRKVGKREALLLLVASRGWALGAEQRALVARASESALDRWLLRVVGASTVEGVFVPE